MCHYLLLRLATFEAKKVQPSKNTIGLIGTQLLGGRAVVPTLPFLEKCAKKVLSFFSVCEKILRASEKSYRKPPFVAPAMILI